MPADRESFVIEETAARWMVERDRGLSAAKERELMRWLDEDARHAAVFNALAETWQLIGDAGEMAAPAARSSGFRSRRGGYPWLLAAAAVAIAAFGSWRLAQPRVSDNFTLASATEVGGLRQMDLPDGSVIRLNTDSAVNVQYRADERRVTLARGEAHFTVAKNRERPFIVSVAGVDVRVVGTVFNVRLRPEAVDVLVSEGKVQVEAPPSVGTQDPAGAALNRSELTAGQKLSVDLAATVSAPAAPVVLTPEKVKQVLAWQMRRLEFEAAPLRDIVAEINRYTRHKLVIVDARLEETRFGGSFPAGDHETVVRMLEANFGVAAERGVNQTRLRMR